MKKLKNNIKKKKNLFIVKTYKKPSLNGLSNIQFNPEELDILANEIIEDKNNDFLNENNNPINIQLSNDEIDILLNEINNKNDNQNDKTLLKNKRKRSFISVKNQQEKENFIHYKSKASLKKMMIFLEIKFLYYHIIF